MNRILTDCDGVLLDWETAFKSWMESKGYFENGQHLDKYNLFHRYDGLTKKDMAILVNEFNNSSTIGFLKPLRDAADVLPKFKCPFTVITSLSKNHYSQLARKQNLQNVFPDVDFDEFIILNTGEPKNKALAKYKGTGYYWIEDKFENALAGMEYGLRSILISHDHNSEKAKEYGIPVCHNWYEVYKLISLIS